MGTRGPIAVCACGQTFELVPFVEVDQSICPSCRTLKAAKERGTGPGKL